MQLLRPMNKRLCPSSSSSFRIQRSYFLITLSLALVYLLLSAPRTLPRHPVHLITQFYADPHPLRAADLTLALKKNLLNPEIDTIHLLQEPVSGDGTESRKTNWTLSKLATVVRQSDPSFPVSLLRRKVRISTTSHSGRLKAFDALEYAQTRLIRGSIAMLSNADIYFDHSLSLLQHPISTQQLNSYTTYFLSRHEHYAPFKTSCTFPFMGSHDAFIWSLPLPAPLLRFRKNTEFELGSWGIENRLLYEFERVGLTGRNPCESIHAWHVHRDGVKNSWMPAVNGDGKSSVAFPDSLETHLKSDYRMLLLL